MISWYVVRTKPKKEFQAENLLGQAGFTVYNPKYRQDGVVKPFFQATYSSSSSIRNNIGL